MRALGSLARQTQPKGRLGLPLGWVWRARLRAWTVPFVSSLLKTDSQRLLGGKQLPQIACCLQWILLNRDTRKNYVHRETRCFSTACARAHGDRLEVIDPS